MISRAKAGRVAAAAGGLPSLPAGVRECFVHIMLPGMTEFTTAGRFVLQEEGDGVALGRFVYGRNYLANGDAVSIDPVELELADGVFETTALNGMFGALRDAGPDYWGRLVIERHADSIQFGEIDYLLHGPDDGIGALRFGLDAGSPAAGREFNKTVDLERLMRIADAVLALSQGEGGDLPSHAAAERVRELMLVGTSMGGARPKTVVEDEEGLWLAKFNRADDRWNHARVEHAMLKLAKACGIESAQSRVVTIGGRDVLLVKRFDREQVADGYARARMISGLTILRADETAWQRKRWSYVLLAEELCRISANPQHDAREVFRRMVFNALISNIDDHPRNHAAIAREREWRLSPAYDLTPSVPISMERRDLAMICGDRGRHAHVGNMLSQCVRFRLEREAAAGIIEEMERRVARTWRETARREGVSERDCGVIQSAFVYPGLRLPDAGAGEGG